MRFGFNLLPKTLFARFMLIISLPPIIGQLVLIFLFYDRHWYNISYYTSNIIANEVTSLVNMLTAEQNLTPNGELVKREGEYLNLNYKIVQEEFSFKQHRLTEELQIFKNILNTKIDKKNIVKNAKGSVIIVIFPLNKESIFISIHSKFLLSPTTSIFVWWLIFLSTSLLLISLAFSRNQIRPILQLAAAADDFGRGSNKMTNFRPRGALEIRKAGIAFIKMKNRIEKQVSARTQMLAMISHDLRTPLTRIRLQTELIKQKKLKIEIIDDIQIMNQMITSYLEFAKGEKGEEFTEIDLSKWFKDFLKSKWGNANIELVCAYNKINANIKKLSLERAVSNLINNSLKYATLIKISLYYDQNRIVIDFEDNGPGISDSEKPFIFKPFYRSDKSRPVDSEGSIGLGLTIAKEIINNIQGTITLKDSPSLNGLLIRITLPKIDNNEQNS